MDGPSQQNSVEIRDLSFAWTRGGPQILGIDSFQVGPGEAVLLRGPSGSGKSTLLSLIAGVTTTPRGIVNVLGTDLATLSGGARDAYRADRLGIIFQLFNLIPYLSMVDNVLLPTRLSSERAKKASAGGQTPSAAATALLERLGLGDLISDRRSVSTLSVGQQQRVAAARALMGAPSLIIADEPTSALDTDARDSFMTTLMAEVQRTNAALLFVSHDPALSSYFSRTVELADINQAARAPVGKAS